MEFDALSIEHSFARLIGSRIGDRGTVHDADVFRSGRAKDLAKALGKAVDALEKQANALKWASQATEPGGPKARLDVSISQLRRIATRMSSSNDSARENPDWETIGALIGAIAALLERG